MNAIQLTDPTELKVVTGWLQESRIRMVRNVLFGSAAIVGAAGLGIAANRMGSGTARTDGRGARRRSQGGARRAAAAEARPGQDRRRL